MWQKHFMKWVAMKSLLVIRLELVLQVNILVPIRDSSVIVAFFFVVTCLTVQFGLLLTLKIK
jgi:hypothetical protein